MAKIEDLIAQIPDERLRKALREEVRELKKTKKFGLVFEEHLPETVRLPNLPVKVGELVAKKQDTGNELWRVKSIKKKTAMLEKPLEGYRTPADEDIEASLDELVVVRSFGDPIYPALTPIDKVARGGPDKPWHVLINSDNFHALQLLLYAYEGKVDVIYIDPPYNTGARDWKYNNDYVDKTDSFRHSKWLSMMKKRLLLAKRLLKRGGIMVIAIDDCEVHHLRTLAEDVTPELRELGVVVVRTSPSGRPTLSSFRIQHDYAIFYGKGEEATVGQLDKSEAQNSFYSETDKDGRFAWVNLRKRGGANTRRAARPKQFYPIYVCDDQIRIPALSWDNARRDYDIQDAAKKSEKVIWPISPTGEERIWSLAPNTARTFLRDKSLRVESKNEDEPQIYRKQRPASEGSQPSTFWDRADYSTVEHGSVLLTDLFSKANVFDFPKSLYTVIDCLRVAGADKADSLVLDFFGGSGTTLHATALMNARDGGSRRAILVTNNEVEEKTAKRLNAEGKTLGQDAFEAYGVCNAVTWPRCKSVLEGADANGDQLKGTYLGSDIDGNTLTRAEGLAENAAYYRLDFVDPDTVARGDAFQAVLPILWMMAGCRGELEESKGSTAWLIPKQSPFAVLIREKEFPAFRKKLAERNDIEWVFLVTDSDDNFAAMRRALGRKYECRQLYKSYLDNFRINTRSTTNA
jgi:adenine-specific DNA-methyltransferase